MYFKVHIRELKTYLKVKRLVLPEGSCIEPGVTTINWNQHKWSSVTGLEVSLASKRATRCELMKIVSSATVCDTYS